jgi:hypothetical protein
MINSCRKKPKIDVVGTVNQEWYSQTSGIPNWGSHPIWAKIPREFAHPNWDPIFQIPYSHDLGFLPTWETGKVMKVGEMPTITVNHFFFLFEVVIEIFTNKWSWSRLDYGSIVIDQYLYLFLHLLSEKAP